MYLIKLYQRRIGCECSCIGIPGWEIFFPLPFPCVAACCSSLPGALLLVVPVLAAAVVRAGVVLLGCGCGSTTKSRKEDTRIAERRK